MAETERTTQRIEYQSLLFPINKVNFNFPDNLTDLDMNETIENIKNLNDPRKNSITDYFNLKRLSATSLFNTHVNNKTQENQNDIMLNRGSSNGSRERESFRKKIRCLNNEDQLKFIRSISQISNRVNHENDLNKNSSKKL